MNGYHITVPMPRPGAQPSRFRREFILAIKNSLLKALREGSIDSVIAEEAWRGITDLYGVLMDAIAQFHVALSDSDQRKPTLQRWAEKRNLTEEDVARILGLDVEQYLRLRDDVPGFAS